MRRTARSSSRCCCRSRASSRSFWCPTSSCGRCSTRGAFTAADAAASGATLAAYAIGLLPFVLLRSVTATFLARGDTATPVKALFVVGRRQCGAQDPADGKPRAGRPGARDVGRRVDQFSAAAVVRLARATHRLRRAAEELGAEARGGGRRARGRIMARRLFRCADVRRLAAVPRRHRRCWRSAMHRRRRLRRRGRRACSAARGLRLSAARGKVTPSPAAVLPPSD